jgi:hypothetical protein
MHDYRRVVEEGQEGTLRCTHVHTRSGLARTIYNINIYTVYIWCIW